VEIFFKYILPILGLMITLGIPFVYVLLTGRFGKGIGLTWFLIVAWYFILSIPVYHVLWHSHKELVIETLPEGNSIMGALFVGPIYGLIVSGLSMLVRVLLLKIKPSLLERRRYNEEE
jgi:hypothetical protein